MAIESADRRDANRILSGVLEDPAAVPKRDLDRALELLGSDKNRVQIGAAWVFGVVGADSPENILPYVPEIATYLDDPTARSAATRALAYVAESSPELIERQLREIDETLARRCRQALWGEFASRTVVSTPDRDDERGTSMSSTGGDHWDWGWMGGGSTGSFGTESASARRRPPTERPVGAPAVEYDYDRYTPTEMLHTSDTVQTFKVIYRSDATSINPGLFKRFSVDSDAFHPAFDRRIGMWQSIDDHDGILPVVDWGTEPEPWIVTAYEDPTGVAALGANGRFGAALWTLQEVADALRFAHARGVIHGALTPGSVVRTSIISEPDAWRYPRVTDWGYVDLLRDGVVPESIPKAYLAPEHLDPNSFGGVDGTTDVYGFGVLACEALLGQAPFADGDVTARTLPAELDGAPPQLDSFLRRCLATHKPERFETVSAMASAFRTMRGDLGG